MKQLLLLTFFVQLLIAAPAFHGKRTFTQPNGEKVTYRLQGDEYLHWMERDDGSIMLFSKERNRLESALIKDNILRPSGIMVTSKKRTSSQKSTPSITREELLELQHKRRVERVSKMHRVPLHH